MFRHYLANLRGQGLARTTVARRLAAWRSFYRYLLREKVIEENYLSRVLSPKLEKRLPRFLYEGEAAVLVEAPDLKHPLGVGTRLFWRYYMQGAEINELVSLTCGTLTERGVCAVVMAKGHGKARSAWVAAVNALRGYLAEARPRVLAKRVLKRG